MELASSMSGNGCRCQYSVEMCSRGAYALGMSEGCILASGQTLPGVLVML